MSKYILLLASLYSLHLSLTQPKEVTECVRALTISQEAVYRFKSGTHLQDFCISNQKDWYSKVSFGTQIAYDNQGK